MSLIAAIVDNKGTVHMIADTLASNSSGDRIPLEFPKIAAKKDTETDEIILVGACGTNALGQFFTHAFTLPPIPRTHSKEALQTWACTLLREKLIKEMGASKLLIKNKDESMVAPGPLLLGVRGLIVHIGIELFPISNTRRYVALGSGEETLNGVLYISLLNHRKPLSAKLCERYLLTGARAASAHKISVSPPYTHLTTDGLRHTFKK